MPAKVAVELQGVKGTNGLAPVKVKLEVLEIAVRPERQAPSLRAGYASGKEGGSIYTKLIPAEPWEISIEVPADEIASLEGLANVVRQLYEQMDLILVLAEGHRPPGNPGYAGKEIRAR